MLMGKSYAYPQFKQKYGTYYPALDEWVIDATWQAALGDASTCGSVIGLLISGHVTERFGHRKVIMVALVVVSGFIFLSFFAPNNQVLLAGQVLCGIPRGIFAIMRASYACEVCPLALDFLCQYLLGHRSAHRGRCLARPLQQHHGVGLSHPLRDPMGLARDSLPRGFVCSGFPFVTYP